MPKAKQNLEYTSDKDLVLLLNEGDEEALNAIFFRYWEQLYWSSVRVLQDEDTAKDVVQNVFVKIWENRLNVEILNLPAYLKQAVRFQVITQLNRGKYTGLHEAKLDLLFAESDTEEIINRNELHDLIVSLLGQLPERCREIFFLSRFKHLNNREIAGQLNISVRTVETQISKTLKFLKNNIDLSSYLILGYLLLCR
jgi:RNA polymerase sigma-70 factor (ECF subfamily)